MSLDAIKQNQMKVLYSLLIVLSILVFGMGYLLFEKGKVSPQKATNYKSSLISATSQIDPKEIWVERISQEAQLNQQRIDSLEKGVETIIKTMESKVEQSSTTNLQNGEDIVTGIRSDIKALQNDDFIERSKGQTIHLANTPVISSEEIKKITQKRVHTKGIQRTSLSLVHSRGQKPLKTFDNTIPAGTFARAVLLGGVDANTSIHASNDPRPILLRITGHGNLPRRFKSDLCDCHVLAATYGDISSERVYMRLEKLTCVERRTGEVVEMNVTGYVAGEDGRAGLRGDVVDRAGESVRAAAVGGFIGGMAHFMAQSNNNPTTFSLQSGLSQTNPLANGEILKQGASKGATTAMEKYADFYIKRAEQMQPVISVEAGRIADIVFTQGVAFEDSAARSALVRSSDQTRYQQIQESQTETKPVDAWVPKREG